jgi:hypothetical protein
MNLRRKFCDSSCPAVIIAIVALLGCSSYTGREITSFPVSETAGVNRRDRDLPANEKSEDRQVASTQPARVFDPLAKPYRLNPTNIVHMVYELNPKVRSFREEMIAAQHALEEFQTNLSRFEPFTRLDADVVDYPKRREAEGATGEIVGGIEKETFEGAILRVEGGASGSRFEYGEVDEGQDEVERGSGGLVRARFEIPFVGSRKRQNRVISQAFQESSAREAELNYLSYFRTYVTSALTYYYIALRYLNYGRAYEQKLNDIQMLINDPRCRPEDKLRLETEAGEIKVYLGNYQAQYREALADTLRYLGLQHDDEYLLEELTYKVSPYLETSNTPEGLKKMTEDAYRNNPQFRVLGNAIENAELQRDLAIRGKFDITAFVEGTQFAFGSESFDDRVGGWELGAGLSVRLNDPKVLTATRRKTEAQIRQFRAEIDSARLKTQHQIATESDALHSNHKIRLQLLENIKQSEAEYKERVKRYFNGSNGGNGNNDNMNPITIDDVLTLLNDKAGKWISLASYTYYVQYAELTLMTATGEVYRMVGMEMGDDRGVQLPETDLAAPQK